MNKNRLLLLVASIACTPFVIHAQKTINTSKNEVVEIRSSGLTDRVDNAVLQNSRLSKANLSIAPLKENNAIVFLKLPSGLEYYFYNDEPGVPTNYNDIALMHIIFKIGDTTLINSREMNGGNAVEQMIMEPKFQGDLAEGLKMMTKGDSAIFRLPIATLEANAGMKKPPFAKEGDNAIWIVKMENIETKEANEARKKAEQAGLIVKDEKEIEAYLIKNKLKYTKTQEGVYMVTTKAGNGEIPVNGNSVTVNYTGKLMNGTLFDSNVEPQFNHVQPFSFPLGKGRVIKGWDYGVATMSKGQKATLYIPSSLAYGSHSPSPAIPANSILVFDVELVDFK